MEITLNETQIELLNKSTDFNIICLLQNNLKDDLLTLETNDIGMLYDYCCDQDNIELVNLAVIILKNDTNIIKPIQLNSI